MTEQISKEVVEEKTSEEPKPGTSKEGMVEENSSSEGEIKEVDPSLITDELLQEYASEMPPELPMTITASDKKRFDQMKTLARRSRKRLANMYQLRTSEMPPELPPARKVLEKKGDVLRIKAEEGSEKERKVVLTAIFRSEDPACLAYCVEEDKDVPECISIGSEDTNVEIQRPDVKAILKELADIKRKEADCYEQLAAAITRMTDEEVTEVGERV